MAGRRRMVELEPLVEEIDDFSGGIRGGVSQTKLGVRHVRRADNALFDELLRAIVSRPGTRDVSASVLPAAGHSLLAAYGLSTTRYYVGDGSKVHEIVDGGDYVEQTLPFTVSSNRWSHANLNGAVIAAQEGGANVPMWRDDSVTVGTWLSTTFPAPPTAPTFAADDNTGGVVDPGAHYYRYRWRFKNGSSVASPASAVHTVVGANDTVHLTGLSDSTRPDYVGWTIERTKTTDATLWYVVKDGSGTTATDLASDASLGTLVGVEPGVHGAFPHVEGVVAFRNRFIGWDQYSLYVSQEIADLAEGSGIFNVDPENVYPIEKDDGDVIKLCLVAGDRVVIFKAASIHVLEGTDPTNFVRRRLPGNVGTPSSRGAAMVGTALFFYGGDRKFYVLDGEIPRLVGKPEMYEYFAQMDTTKDANVVCWDQDRGARFGAAVTLLPDAYNQDVFLFSPLYRNWSHQKRRITDVLVPKKIGAFSSARFLFTDPKSVAVPTGSPLSPTDPTFHVWSDARSAALQYFAAKVTAAGASLWTTDGVQVSLGNVTPTLTAAASIPDGVGGLIVAYVEGTTTASGQVVVQRLGVDGSKQWGAAGVVLSNPAVTDARKDDVVIVADRTGGAIVAWIEQPSGISSGQGKIVVQRVNGTGVAQWAANGVTIAGTVKDRRILKARATLDGGIYVAWNNITDTRTEVVRITSAGAIHAGWTAIKSVAGFSGGASYLCLADDSLGGLWVGAGQKVLRFLAADGSNPFAAKDLLASSSFSITGFRAMVPDGAGGAIAVYWTFEVAGSLQHVQAQRLDSAGNFLWAAAGVDLYTAAAATINVPPRAIQDGAGGVIAVWQKNVSPFTMRAQHLNSLGVRQWGTEGVTWRNLTVASEVSNSIFNIATDGGGGVVVLWQDDRPGSGNLNNLYAQRIGALGTEQWAADGVQLCAATGTQTPFDVEFTASPSGDYPAAGAPGYHVWAGYDGVLDERAADGTGGSPIAFRVETPDSDDGQPNIEKEYDRVTLLAKGGTAALSVTLAVDDGLLTASVPIGISVSSARWGSASQTPDANTLVWGQGKWASQRPQQFVGAIPAGMIGKRARLNISGDLTDSLILSGAHLEYDALPDRSY